MVPAKRCGRISPIDAERVAETEHIFAEITGEINPVVLTELIICLRIQVVEIKPYPIDTTVAGKLEEQI